jgi:hypothetical protein
VIWRFLVVAFTKSFAPIPLPLSGRQMSNNPALLVRGLDEENQYVPFSLVVSATGASKVDDAEFQKTKRT